MILFYPLVTYTFLFSSTQLILLIWSVSCTTDSPTLTICGNKMPTTCNRCFLLQILLLAQHVSGTIMPIIRSSRVLYSWLLPVVFGAWFSSCRYSVELRVVCPVCGLLQLENQAPKTTGSNQLYNTLELLMMGIMVPETCWGRNMICNKKHLLHLVGILFHIISMMHGQNPFKSTLTIYV
jgi:hypothetical protein